MIETTPEAIEILKDEQRSEAEREEAVHYLQDQGSPEAVDALVAALQTTDYGVRWSAARALAALGAAGIPALLRALVSSAGGDQLMREGAHHVLKENADPEVRSKTQGLLKALKGPSADIETMMVARKLLNEWQ